MKRLLVMAACILTVFFTVSFSSAAQFTGTISLNGTDTFTPTSITFVGAANIGGVSGNFSVIGTCIGCVTMSNFSSGSTNFQVYTATNGGVTTTLNLSATTFTFQPCGLGFNCLTISGSGTATLTGFDPTPGQFTLTSQCATPSCTSGTTTFTFSSTTITTASPQSCFFEHYANNAPAAPGVPDQIIRIINVGTLGTPMTSPTGDICANIYVFDADQEMIACCSTRLTPNELNSAKVGAQLTAHPLNSVVPDSGVLKICLAPPPTGGCNPAVSTTTPDASLGVVFATHLQIPLGGQPYFVTETQTAPSTLSAAEEGFLQTACSYTLYLGSKFSGFCSTTASSGQN